MAALAPDPLPLHLPGNISNKQKLARIAPQLEGLHRQLEKLEKSYKSKLGLEQGINFSSDVSAIRDTVTHVVGELEDIRL
jgi:hypothetical protein